MSNQLHLLLTLLALTFPLAPLTSQCPITVNAGPGQFVCNSGEQVTLNGSITGNYLGFGWTPGTGLNDPNILTPTATVLGPMTYTLAAQAFDPAAPNLVANPAFEMGNTAFTSDYTYTPSPITPGTYFITTSPAVVISTFPPCDDHTFGNGTGNMMLVNGAGVPGANIWCQTIPVSPNTTYTMSAWVISSPIDPAALQFAVNGTLAGSVYNYSGSTCQWQQFSASWNSGSATTADVCITTQNSGNGTFGDDYALDDIYFGAACTVMDEVMVDVVAVNAALPPTAILPCSALPGGMVLNGSGSTSGPNISYQWTTFGGNIVSGSSTPSATVDAEGSYTLTVTYDDGIITCTDFATVQLLPDPNIVFAAAAAPNMLNCASPTITLDGGGSSSGSGISYAWTPAAGIVSGGNSIYPVVNQPGTYTLTVSNFPSGCTATAMVTVTANFDTPVAAGNPPDTLDCLTDSLTLSGQGSTTGAGISYQWTTPGGNILSGGNTLNNCVVDAPGTYQLTVTNSQSQCTAIALVPVSQDTLAPVAVAGDTASLDCLTPSVTLDGSGSGAGAYLWTTANGHIVSGDTTLFPVVDSAGEYVLTVSASGNGCTASDTATVVANTTPPIADIGPPDTFTCVIDSVQLDGTASSQGSGFTFFWTTSGGNIASGDTTLMPVVDGAGAYFLTVTDTLNGCTATDSVQVVENTVPPIAEAGAALLTGCGVTLDTLDGSGSTQGAAMSYLWTTSGGNIVSGDSTLLPVVDAAGMYFLTVTGTTNGCAATDSVAVTQSGNAPQVAVSVSGQLDCAVSTLLLDGSGSAGGPGIVFVWASPNGHFSAGQNTLTPEVDAPGTYTLTLTDTTSMCAASVPVTVLQDTVAPIADAGPAAVLNCLSATATLGGSGSDQGPLFSYQWTTTGGNITTGDTTLTPVVDGAGAYILTVSNNQNSCTATDTVLVTADTLPPVAVAGPPDTLTCVQSSATPGSPATSTGPEFIYTWTTAGGMFSGPADSAFTVVTGPGMYTLLVTDTLNGCTASDSVAVAQSVVAPQVQIEMPGALTCATPQTELTGSVTDAGLLLYQWTTPDGHIAAGADTLVAVADAPGNYLLTVTNAANGCADNVAVVVAQDTLSPIADAGAGFTLSCGLQSAILDGSLSSQGSGFNYVWATPNGHLVSGDTTLMPVVDAPGLYILTVTGNANGCTANDTVLISQDANAPIASIAAADTLNCTVSSVVLDGTGSSSGSGIVFSWTANGGNIASGGGTLQPVVDASGTYLLTVTDTANNCQSAASVQVFEDVEPPVADAGGGGVLTCLTTILTLDGMASGNGNLTYSWTTPGGNIVSGANTLTPVVDAPGTYTLTVTNTSNGCTMADAAIVAENAAPPAAAAAAPLGLTCILTEVSLDGTGSGVGGSFTYAWATSGGSIVSGDTTLTPIVDAPGTYTLTVTDAGNGCTATAITMVSVDTVAPVVVIALPGILGCAQTEVTLDGSGSSSGLDFTNQWTTAGGHFAGGVTTLTPAVDAPGIYTLTITDTGNGCTASGSVEVTQNTELPAAVIAPPLTLTCADSLLTLDASGSDAGGIFTLNWTTADGHFAAATDSLLPVVDAPGVYTLAVTNQQNGCSATASVTVVANTTPPGAVAGDPDPLTCKELIVALTGSSPTLGVLFHWTTADGHIVFDANSPTPSVDQPGFYTLTVTDPANGCTSSEEVQVVAVTLENFSFEKQNPACPERLGSITFGGVQGGVGPFSFSVDGGSTFSTDPVFDSLPPGLYDLLVRESGGCELAEIVELAEPPEVVVSLEPEAAVALGDSYLLSPVLNLLPGQVSSVVWAPEVGLDCVDCLRPHVTPSGETVYTVEVTDVNGCTGTAAILIKVDRQVDVYVPNVFSPNNDGINDRLVIFAKPGLLSRVLNFRVFTRWGESVFEAQNFPPNDQSYGWDGRHRSKDLDAAVFVWLAEVELIDGSREILKGGVTLLR
jgi:large repetitive protein